MAAEPDVESEIEPDVEPDVPEEPQADYDQPAAESSMATDWVEPQAADEPSSDTLFAIPPEPEPTAEFASDSSLEFAPAYESAIIPEPEADEPLDLADAEPYVEEIEAETLDPESIGEDADPSVEAEAYPETSPTQPDTDSDQSAPSAAQVEFHSAEPGQAISGDFSSDSAPEAASAPDAAQDGSWASLAASPGPVDSSSRRTGEFDYGVASDEHSPLDGLAARIQEPSDVVAPPPEPVAMERDEDFVDLSEWLRGGDTTSRTADSEFSDMLETFKRGVAESMDDGDSESHYDLGVAYKEMGLLAEAIAQFEKAIRGSAPADRRVRAYESLGECHIETQNYETAVSALYGALTESSLTDDKLVGVLYLLGYAAECLDRWTDARAYYKRVYAVDPSFRDIDQRFRHASRAAEAAEV